MKIILYLVSVLAANVITALVQPIHIGALIFPAGSLIIGLTFILRDFLQREYGKRTAYYSIAGALSISLLTSYIFGDMFHIVLASIAAFIVSEITDTEIYSRMKTSLAKRVLYSGIVGGALDSVIFVVLGLSPIGAGFLTWGQVAAAIAGQFLAKAAAQIIAYLVLRFK